MSYKIRKSFTFEAAHQLETSFTKECHECIHGHSYKVEMVISCLALALSDDIMVIDFGELKPFKDEVMEKWDHGLLLHENKRKWIQPLIDAGVLRASKVTFLRVNPTAEAMAKILYANLVDFVGCLTPPRSVEVYKVRVHETSTGWAEYGQ